MKLFRDLCLELDLEEVFAKDKTEVFSDSQVGIRLSKMDLHTKSMYIALQQHFAKYANDRFIKISHVPGTDNPADLLTKDYSYSSL